MFPNITEMIKSVTYSNLIHFTVFSFSEKKKRRKGRSRIEEGRENREGKIRKKGGRREKEKLWLPQHS